MVKIEERKSKTILNRYKYRDNWFWCKYGVNPYRGCQFACNYCDAMHAWIKFVAFYILHNIDSLPKATKIMHGRFSSTFSIT